MVSPSETVSFFLVIKFYEKSITHTSDYMKLYPNEKAFYTTNHIYEEYFIQKCSSDFELPDGIVNIKC